MDGVKLNDVTPEQLRFLTDAGAKLATTLSADALLRTIPEMCVPELADWCTVHLLAEHGFDSRAVGAHRDPSKQCLLDELVQDYPAHNRNKGGVAQAMRTGELQRFPQVDGSVLASTVDDPRQAELQVALGIGSSLVLPLVARGRTLGSIALIRAESHAFGPGDETVAEEFASRAALALDNARLFRAVQDTEHRLRDLVESLDVVLWESPPGSDSFSFVSAQAEKMFGHPVGRWLTEPRFWESLIHPADRAEAVRRCQEETSAGRGVDLEYRMHAADGRVLWVRDVVRVVLDADGQVVKLRGLFLDVTAEKRREQRRAVELVVARILSEEPHPDRVVDRVLQEVCEAMGWSFGDLWVVDDEADELRFAASWMTDSIDATRFAEASRGSTFERGQGLAGRVWERREPVWVDDVIADDNFPRGAEAAEVGLRTAFGVPILVSGHVRAVLEFFAPHIEEPDPELLETVALVGSQLGGAIERQRALAELRISESRKTAILEAALDAVITIDPEGYVLDFNRAAEELFGHRRQDVAGKELAELIIPERLREAHRSALERYRSSGELRVVGKRLELPALRADGSEFLAELTITPAATDEHEFFTGQLRDVTDRKDAEETLRFQKALLESQSESMIDGVMVLSYDGRILHTNSRFHSMWGIPPSLIEEGLHDEIIAGVVAKVADPEAFLERIRRLAIRPDEDARDTVELSDGRIFERWTTSLRDGEGARFGRAWYFRDITEQVRSEATLRESEERSSFLAKASAMLTASLDPSTALERIAEVAIPNLATVCIVDVVDRDGHLRRSVFGRRDPARGRVVTTPESPLDLEEVTAIAQVLRSGRSTLRPRVEPEGLGGFIPEGDRHDTEDLGAPSVVSAPLIARRRTLGVITFLNAEGRPTYDGDGLWLAEALAQRAALAMDNARLYEDRARIAQTLQRGLLPPELPVIAGLDIAARYHPAEDGAEVGGDFYDAFRRAEGSWGIAIGDVAGKGAEAAVLTALARYTIRTAAMQNGSPSDVLCLLNEALLRQTDDRYCTAAYARVDRLGDRTRVTLASAGHPLPYLIKGEADIRKAGRAGMMLGVIEDVYLEEATIDLDPGDTLVFYTDGVTEARGPNSFFGEGMLLSLLGWYQGLDADGIARRIERTVVEFQRGNPRDDIAVVVLRAAPNHR